MRTSVRKIDSENYIVRIIKIEFKNCFSTVCKDSGKWFVDYNWSNEYDTKEEALKVAKTLTIQLAENKLNN